MTTIALISEKEVSGLSVKRIGEPTLLTKKNIVVVWFSYHSINESSEYHCDTRSF